MKHFDVLRTLFLFLFALLVYGCSDMKGINVDMYSEENNIDNIKKNEDVVSVEYVVGDSIPVALSNLFYVKLKSQSDLPLLESEAKKIGCIVEHVVETFCRNDLLGS